MLKNKKFARYAIAFNLLGIVFNFMYSGLQNDQINIIQAFSAWNNNVTLLPLTIGNLVCIVLTFIYGTLFIKVGIKKTLIPCIGLSALGCLGIAAANGIASVNGAVINSVAPGGQPVCDPLHLYVLPALRLYAGGQLVYQEPRQGHGHYHPRLPAVFRHRHLYDEFLHCQAAGR